MPSGSALLEILGRLPISDKVLHFSGYALLALLPAIHERFRTAALLAATLAAMGVLLEFTQKHVQGRSFEVADMAANAAGLLCGLIAGFAWRRSPRA
jgi:VanZ family protein